MINKLIPGESDVNIMPECDWQTVIFFDGTVPF